MINWKIISFVEKSESLSKTYYVKWYRWQIVLLKKKSLTNTMLAIIRLQFPSLCHQVFWSLHEKKASHHRKPQETMTTIWNYQAKSLWNRICGTTSIYQAVCRLFPTAGRSWALREITQNVFLKRVSQAGEWGHHGENATPAFSAAPWESSDQKTGII